MMPPFVVFPTNRIAHFVEVSLYFILSSTTSKNYVYYEINVSVFEEIMLWFSQFKEDSE